MTPLGHQKHTTHTAPSPTMSFDPKITVNPDEVGAIADAAAIAPEDPAFDGTGEGASSNSFSFPTDVIDTTRSIFGFIFRIVTDLKSYLASNAWSIVFLLLAGYLFNSYVFDPWYSEYKRRLSYREATDPKRTVGLDADLRQVREAQQAAANIKARAAAEEAKKRALEAKETKRVKSPMENKGGDGQRLGGARRRKNSANDTSRRVGPSSRLSSTGYNAMDPSASGTNRYVPTRRSTNRG